MVGLVCLSLPMVYPCSIWSPKAFIAFFFRLCNLTWLRAQLKNSLWFYPTIPTWHHFCWCVELMSTPKISNLPQHIILETLHHCPSLLSLLSPFQSPFLNNFFFVGSKLLAKVIPFTMHMIHYIITICHAPYNGTKVGHFQCMLRHFIC